MSCGGRKTSPRTSSKFRLFKSFGLKIVLFKVGASGRGRCCLAFVCVCGGGGGEGGGVEREREV